MTELEKRIRSAFRLIDSAEMLNNRTLDIVISRLIDIAEKERSKEELFKFNYSTTEYREILAFLSKKTREIVMDLILEMESISKITGRKWVGKVPDDKFDTEAFLATKIKGKTFEDRLKIHARKFAREIEGFTAMSFKEGYSKNQIKNLLIQDKYSLSSREDVRDAMLAGIIATSGVSASYSIKRLIDDTLVRGMHASNKHYWRYAPEKKIVAVIDNNTCSDCVAIDGKVFLMHEDILPLHLSCRCIEIPIINTNRV